MTRKKILSSGGLDNHGSGNVFWNKLPIVRPPAAGDETLPQLRDEGARLRDNLSADLILPQDKRLAAAYACLSYEFTRDDFVSHGLSPPAFDAEVFSGMDYIKSPEYRIFALRYAGPEFSAKGPRGIVEVRNGNLLGYHAQRTFGALSDGFFETILREKESGANPADIYSRLVEPTRMEILEYSDGQVDVFSYDHACDFTENPRLPKNAIFLMNINTLPCLGGVGLSEPALKQVLFRALDTEKAKYAFAYARMDELYTMSSPVDGRPYVPEEAPRRRFEDAMRKNTLSRLGLADDLDEDTIEFVVMAAEKGGITELQENVARTRAEGLSAFRTARFHERAGGIVACGLPQCASDDFESFFAGVLIIYDLKKLRSQGKI